MILRSLSLLFAFKTVQADGPAAKLFISGSVSCIVWLCCSVCILL